MSGPPPSAEGSHHPPGAGSTGETPLHQLGLEDQTGTSGLMSDSTSAQEGMPATGNTATTTATHSGESSQAHPSTTLAPAPAGEQPSEHQQPIPPGPPAGQPIQDPAHIAIDADSAYGDDDVSAYTASLTSSVVNFPVENGRRYHAFREGTYVFPNDEPEQDRMDLQHEMYKRAVFNKLHLAPLPGNMKDKRILDLGTGTGIWCVEMADQYPEAEVIGNDFSPVQPTFVPRNVKFEVDDIESPWTHTQKFDYIHARFLAGAIADWPALIRRCYDALQPGGFIECQDGDFMSYSEDGSSKGTWLEKWNTEFVAAAKQGGRIVTRVRLPLGIWPKEKQLKEVGAFNHIQLREGVEGFSLALFTRILGWTADEVQVLLSKVRKDLDNRNIHAQNDMHIVWGRKPMN